MLIAIGFAISCFALLLFLWVTFGGAVPLKSKGYRVTVPFDEATQLAVESDVRISGLLQVTADCAAWRQLPPKVQTPTNTKARSLLEKAQQQTKERNFIKAIETLNQLNQKFPSFGDAFLLKGSLLKSIGDNREPTPGLPRRPERCPPRPCTPPNTSSWVTWP